MCWGGGVGGVKCGLHLSGAAALGCCSDLCWSLFPHPLQDPRITTSLHEHPPKFIPTTKLPFLIMLTSASRTAARVAHQFGSRAVSSGRPLATAWTAPTPEQAAVPATEGKLDAVVMKFGGSSVGNAPAVRNVGRLLKAYRDAGSRCVCRVQRAGWRLRGACL